ncbi:MAG: ribosomal protein L7/L12 [Proteobacteria bacterium]|nr:ribosomal protein L7/L12 [Pseudomonadota bacterium]
MDKKVPDLPQHAIEFARNGQIIEAVKATREHTGLSLKEAKDAVDAFVKNPLGESISGKRASATSDQDIPYAAILALEEGRLIDAIKAMRETHGLELKITVERYLEEHPELHARYKAASSASFQRTLKKGVTALVFIGLVVLGYMYLTGQM